MSKDKKPENPSAFPWDEMDQSHPEFVYQHHKGMTLRDYFAAKALNGMLAHPKRYQPRPEASLNWHEAISEEAYELADAMLKERENE